VVCPEEPKLASIGRFDLLPFSKRFVGAFLRVTSPTKGEGEVSESRRGVYHLA
jgi:hypothetical protein